MIEASIFYNIISYYPCNSGTPRKSNIEMNYSAPAPVSKIAELLAAESSRKVKPYQFPDPIIATVLFSAMIY